MSEESTENGNLRLIGRTETVNIDNVVEANAFNGDTLSDVGGVNLLLKRLNLSSLASGLSFPLALGFIGQALTFFLFSSCLG